MPEPFTLQDFLLVNANEKPERDPALLQGEIMLNKLKMLTFSLGGEVIDHTKKG